MAAAPSDAVGARIPRIDAGGEDCRNRRRFLDDLTRPGMLYAALAVSEYAHARLLSIDISAALALPGVKAIITGRELRVEALWAASSKTRPCWLMARSVISASRSRPWRRSTVVPLARPLASSRRAMSHFRRCFRLRRLSIRAHHCYTKRSTATSKYDPAILRVILFGNRLSRRGNVDAAWAEV